MLGTPTRAWSADSPYCFATEGDIAAFQFFIYGAQLH